MDAATKQRMVKNACWGNVLLGIWLVISPLALTYSHMETAMWNDIVVGVAVCLVALARATGIFKQAKQIGFDWANVILGIWLIISPFALGVSYIPRLMWNNVIVGIVVAGFALSNALSASTSETTENSRRMENSRATG